MSESARDKLKVTAANAGARLGQGAGDFYDVVEALAAGYVSGIGAEPGTAHAVKMKMAALNELVSVAGNVLAGVVAEERELGMPWSEIGDALEITRQAAQQKYGKKP